MTNEQLLNRYPFLIPRNSFTGKIVDGFDYTYNEMEANIPAGWWKRWGELWCEDLLNFCKQNNYDPNEVMLLQVKEKFGGLRVYHNGLPEGWTEHEYAWEYISQHTCIECGEFPVPLRDDGWICPYCDKCFKKNHNNASKEEIERWTCESDKMQEYITIMTYSASGTTKKLIDMKPYYSMLGWKYRKEDLIGPEEKEK